MLTKQNVHKVIQVLLMKMKLIAQIQNCSLLLLITTYMSVYKDYLHKHCLLKTACPIRGQIYYPECAPCDGTCENPNPVCPQVCKPGCACPAGQVIQDGRMCVSKTDCPPGNLSAI